MFGTKTDSSEKMAQLERVSEQIGVIEEYFRLNAKFSLVQLSSYESALEYKWAEFNKMISGMRKSTSKEEPELMDLHKSTEALYVGTKRMIKEYRIDVLEEKTSLKVLDAVPSRKGEEQQLNTVHNIDEQPSQPQVMVVERFYKETGELNTIIDMARNIILGLNSERLENQKQIIDEQYDKVVQSYKRIVADSLDDNDIFEAYTKIHRTEWRETKSMIMTPDTQSTLKTVNDRCLDLLKTMKLSDCSFSVGPEHNKKVFRAHKLILAISSPVFETMFFGSLAEKEYPVRIPDVDPSAFQTLLEYIYTDRINVGPSFENATALCYAAQKYMLPHVVEYCIKYLTSNLNPKNACHGYEFAKFFDKPHLIKASMEVIMDKTSEVLADPGFVNIEMSTLIEILDKDVLNIVSEFELFNALDRYAKNRGSLTAEYDLLRQAVKKIRFLLMTPKEFAESSASSKLLDQHEKFAILMNISSQSVKCCPMPEGFTTTRSKRKTRIKTYAQAHISRNPLHNYYCNTYEQC